MANIEYQIASEKDLFILNNLYADMNDTVLMSEATITKVWQQIQEVPDYYIYLAYLGSKAIETFRLLFMPTMMYSGFHKSAILDSVTILSTCRGKGYGEQMIREALKVSADTGCYKVTLSSGIKRDRAHNFYQFLGFQQHGWSFSYQLNKA